MRQIVVIPRTQIRGLIEAPAPAAWRDAVVLIPRTQIRGLIEARITVQEE